MVNHSPPFQTEERRGTKKGEEQERREEKRNNRPETQWCSGITRVLARLRAHYPEHQHKNKRREDREDRQ
nr:MAG TPA: hypothetical protein [Caudoviricetes sp.]